jgi:hypothetical protein
MLLAAAAVCCCLLLLLLAACCCCLLLLLPAAGNTVLCPQSCLNLGSWATLFKLTSNCICEQTKLYQLQQHSLAVATDAGVALGGLILIYFGSCCMHAYLISERVHAGYDYRKVRGTVWAKPQGEALTRSFLDVRCAVPLEYCLLSLSPYSPHVRTTCS